MCQLNKQKYKYLLKKEKFSQKENHAKYHKQISAFDSIRQYL